MTLSKSDYMLFIRHPAWLWLKKFDKYKLPPIDDNTQAMFDTGHDFESYAEQLFPEGFRLGFSNYDEYLLLPEKTQEALNRGAKAIFQGRFEAKGITCIIDVLERVSDNVFDLVEIKSSTRAKPEHYYDLAFQLLVLEKSGIEVRNIYVMHANKDYVRNGDINSSELVGKTDVTEKVRELSDVTVSTLEKARELLDTRVRPDISPRHVNTLGISGTTWFADWMTVFESLVPELDTYSIYYLSYPSAEQIGKLEDRGIELISDISEEHALRPKQIAQIKTTKNNTRIIEKEKIKEFLDTFTYPLYFFDYETLSSIIPPFDGMSPYKDYPFQYSLHVLESPDAKLKHLEYIHTENSNPMPDLIEQLKKDIGDSGTVLTWNMVYEKSCNTRMASFYPEHKEFLEGVNERILDLMTPFSEMWFVDKDFFGSASVKNVLPVLCPELSYKELDVSDGLLARRVWTETYLQGKNKENTSEIYSNLSKYCTLDTFAMVKILDKLKEILI